MLIELKESIIILRGTSKQKSINYNKTKLRFFIQQIAHYNKYHFRQR